MNNQFFFVLLVVQLLCSVLRMNHISIILINSRIYLYQGEECIDMKMIPAEIRCGDLDESGLLIVYKNMKIVINRLLLLRRIIVKLLKCIHLRIIRLLIYVMLQIMNLIIIVLLLSILFLLYR